MRAAEPDTDHLLERAETGDEHAVGALLARHRSRLRAMVRVRLDRRVAARVDPSDVVQESLLEAYRRLPEYLRDRPIPFYPWLRRLAWERLVRLHQRHMGAKRRSVDREVAFDPLLSDDSIAALASRLCSSRDGPRSRLIRSEMRSRLRAMLGRLSETDRELLIERYLEQLSISDIMAVLGLKESAVKLRLLRALERLRKLFDGDDGK